MRVVRSALVCGALAVIAGCGDGQGDGVLAFSGSTMGTTYTVKLAQLPDGVSLEQLGERADATLERINALMSTYRQDSEISRFNSSVDTGWQPVSAETGTVIAAALEVSHSTGGAFDITVGPLVDLWGFGPAGERDRLPSAAEIARARQRVGFRKLALRTAPPALRKTDAGVHIDLSAIAKGYAVDRLAELLESVGAHDYLVEIGGELRAGGRKPDGAPWRVAIERPDRGGTGIQRVIALEQAGMATSGDYRNFREIDGERYAHTIDPATGRPVRHTLASVSVVHGSTMYADAMATALMVMGPDHGYAFAESQGLAALFVRRAGTGEQPFEELATGAMSALVQADVR